MLVGRDQIIAGVPAVRAREVVRHAYSEVETDALAERIGCASQDLLKLAAALEAEGYLARDTWQLAARSAVVWQATVRGNALAKARIGKPMTRDLAQRLVDKVLQVVDDVNRDGANLFWIDAVRLFGSFTRSEMQTVGDVDLHVIGSCRDDYKAFQRRNRQLAESSGRQFKTFVDVLAYSEGELKKRLRCRSSRIDLQLDVGALRRLPEGVVPIEIYRRHGTRAAEDGAVRRGPDGQVPPWDSPQGVESRGDVE